MTEKKYKAVIVDDEPIIRLDITNILENAGYDIVGVGADGYEAIELCSTHKPDVALLDVKMENLDGITAAEVISEECKETAIILLTAYNKRDYVDRAKNCRISSYLVKPIDECQLLINAELAVARNKELSKYMRDVDEVNARLRAQRLVARAKGMLMKEKNLTEEDAYCQIRELSKKNNLSMERVAKAIIRKYGN